jgi:hypothetical protein
MRLLIIDDPTIEGLVRNVAEPVGYDLETHTDPAGSKPPSPRARRSHRPRPTLGLRYTF